MTQASTLTDSTTSVTDSPATVIEKLVSVNIIHEWPMVSARYGITDTDIEQIARSDAFMSLIPADSDPEEYIHANMEMVRMIGVVLDRIFVKDDLKLFFEISQEYTMAAGLAFIDALSPEAPFLKGHEGSFLEIISIKAVALFVIFLAGTAGYKDPKAMIAKIRDRISNVDNFDRFVNSFDFETQDVVTDFLNHEEMVTIPSDPIPH